MKKLLQKLTVISEQWSEKWLVILILLTANCALLTLWVPIVSAHVLQTDGSIGAVLHIEPDDDPIAGPVSSIFLEFKDKQNKFSSQNCNCTFSITENGQEIFNQPLFQTTNDPNSLTASIFFTFPQKDIYQLKVTGAPSTPNAFQPFTLTYDVRVERTANTNANQPQAASANFLISHWGYFVGGGVILFFLVWIVLTKFKRKTVS